MRSSLITGLTAGAALCFCIWTSPRVKAQSDPSGSSASRPAKGGKTGTKLEALLADRFGGDPARQEAARRQLIGRPVDAKVRTLAWEAYKASPVHAALRTEWEKKTVSTPDRISPYLWRYVGTKPAGGWGLVIAMHGGGGAFFELKSTCISFSCTILKPNMHQRNYLFPLLY